MEVAGLTIGAVALVGTFKECIDLYSMISASRSLGQDAALLETKLDVEKMLFFQWADRVGLVKPEEYDTRLDDPSLNKTVAAVLSSIKTLLGEGNALQTRYGLGPLDPSIDRTSFNDVDAIKASTPRMERFLRNFEQLGLNSSTAKEGTEAKKSFSAKDRWCWVVRDKDKFEQLIQELFHLNSRLHALVPDNSNARSILALTEEDLRDIRSIPHLKMILKAAPGVPHVLEAVKRAIRTANQDRVLQRLWFRRIDDRRETVSGAHGGTFSWALFPPEKALEWDNFCDWLRTEKSGIYWLAGKAGSGKSTLMKYVLGHSRTRELLKEWADGSDLTVADFFFYHLGMPEQKSQAGLFRGLLYQVLSQRRHLIETLIPKTWQEALATEDDPKCEISMPSVHEMQAGLLEFAKGQSGKLFLFIDGLDEYDGRPMDAAAFIEELGKPDGVKILVSSRPLSDFVATFHRKPKMNLQDLTRRDIETYVDDTITRHPYMAKLALEDPSGPRELVQDFMIKSSGVFLWVVLACRSVLEGFAACDNISDLKARVHELPPELEDLFSHMIHGIDARWREQSVKLLRLLFDNQTKEEVCAIPTLGLALSDGRGLRSGWDEPIMSDLTIEQKRIKCEMMEGRLRSRCYGLVEVQRATSTDEPNMVCVCGNNKKHDPFLDSSVVFMHRSVYEFLSVSDVWDSKSMQTDNATFDAILSTLWIEVAGMGQQNNMAHKNICINNALLHIYHSDANGDSPFIVAANLSRLQAIFRGGCYGTFWDEARQGALHQARCRRFDHDLSIGLALAAEMGMTRLLKFAIEQPKDLERCLCPTQEAWLAECTGASSPDSGKETTVSGCQPVYRLNQDHFGPSSARITGLPTLYHAACKPLLQHLRAMNMGFQKTCPRIRGSEAVQYLLANGSDPNERFIQPNGNQVTSPWTCWLRCIGDGPRQDDENDPEASSDAAQITLDLLGAGADLEQPSSQLKDVVSAILGRALSRGPSQLQAWVQADNLWAEVRDKITLPEPGPSAAAERLFFLNLVPSPTDGKADVMVATGRQSITTPQEPDAGRPFACPFFRLNPLEHQDCYKLHLVRVRDVVQHLNRRHDQYRKRFDRTLSSVEQWYEIWNDLYPDIPRPDSPFLGDFLEEALGLVRCAHRFYREQIGDGSVAQLLARQSKGDLSLKDTEEAIEALHFDVDRVRAIMQLITPGELEDGDKGKQEGEYHGRETGMQADTCSDLPAEEIYIFRGPGVQGSVSHESQLAFSYRAEHLPEIPFRPGRYGKRYDRNRVEARRRNGV